MYPRRNQCIVFGDDPLPDGEDQRGAGGMSGQAGRSQSVVDVRVQLIKQVSNPPYISQELLAILD